MKKSQKLASKSASSSPWVSKKYALLSVAALVLVGGTFTVASGSVSVSGNALLADVYSAITGRPMLIVSRNGASPSGTISMGYQSNLAVYDISVKNTTHWATVNSAPFQVSISQSSASPLSLTNFSLRYNYCIPVGAVYGYGYRSAGCSSVMLYPSSAYMNGNTYIANFNGGIPVYPQQYSGTLTVSATPSYAYTASAKNPQSRNASLRVQINGIGASADQCLWTYGFINQTRTYGYSYTGCASYQAIPNVTNANGNTLTVMRPYGYGYNARATAPGVPTNYPPTRPSSTTTPSEVNQQQLQQLQSLIAVLLQQIAILMKARGQ